MKTLSRIAMCSIPALVAVNVLVSCAAQKQSKGAHTSISVRTDDAKSGDVDATDSGLNPCAGPGAWSPKLVGGFCVSSEATISSDNKKLTLDRLKILNDKIRRIESQFPLLVASVRSVGYTNIFILPAETTASGGAVLGEVNPTKKRITLYETFFTIEKDHPELASLGFSVADVVLVHEFLHAFDSDDSVMKSHLKLFGWDIVGNAPAGGLMVEDGAELANIWVKESLVSDLKSRLGPKIETDGAWKVYLEARTAMKDHGYPSIYAAVGGPRESYAELGAYIAMDPKAASYIPQATMKWFKENVLK